MSEPFIGQIIMFGGNFAPRGWAFCDGQLLPIAQNTALFSILGTTYGGDGRTTFGLPDLRGRVPLHAGSGPGLSPRPLGFRGGSESVVLQVANLPAHSHSLKASTNEATTQVPTGQVLADARLNAYGAGPAAAVMEDSSIGSTGGNQPIGIAPPQLAINFIIALQGIFPSRS
ncbi:MAG: tail fiber protein [Pirellulaceae bacterium]